MVTHSWDTEQKPVLKKKKKKNRKRKRKGRKKNPSTIQ
jgi:hypothetical protein